MTGTGGRRAAASTDGRPAHGSARSRRVRAPARLPAEASTCLPSRTLDRVASLAKIGVWQCDLKTERLAWNDGVYDLFELPRGSFVSRPMALDLYEAHSRCAMERMRAEAIATGGSFALDIRIRTALGVPRWLRLTGEAELEKGRAVLVQGTKQDITDARTAQDEVQALLADLILGSERNAIGATVAALAHDLNQPLAAIATYAAGMRRLLDAGREADAAAGEGLEAIAENALRAGALIRRMRDLTGGSSIAPHPTSLNALVRGAASIAMSAPGPEVTLHDRLGDDILLTADAAQLRQVVLAILCNAREALEGSARRQITMSSERRGDRAELLFEDSGPGIATDMLPRLFEAFATTRPGRLGMGLAISRTIVEAHRGEIWAENGRSGARVGITLPA